MEIKKLIRILRRAYPGHDVYYRDGYVTVRTDDGIPLIWGDIINDLIRNGCTVTDIYGGMDYIRVTLKAP